MEVKTIFHMSVLMNKKHLLIPLFFFVLISQSILFIAGPAEAYWTNDGRNTDPLVPAAGETGESGQGGSEEELIPAVDPAMPVVNSDMVEIFRNNRGNLYPINLVNDHFIDQVDAILLYPSPDSVMRVVTEYGQQDIDLFVNTDLIHDLFGKINFDGEYPENFEISADVTVRDVYPKKKGGCYVGFTDNGMTKSPDTDEFLFVFDGNSAMFYNKKGGNDAGMVLFEEPVSENKARITISHMTGHTFVFINDICVGQYHDGKYAPFRISYGVMTLADGKTACCSFDDLVIRKVGK